MSLWKKSILAVFFFLNRYTFIYIYKKIQLIQMPHDTPKFFLWCSDNTARLRQQPCTWKLEHFYTMIETKVAPCCWQRQNPCTQYSDFSIRYLQVIWYFSTVHFLHLLLQQEICLSFSRKEKIRLNKYLHWIFHIFLAHYMSVPSVLPLMADFQFPRECLHVNCNLLGS